MNAVKSNLSTYALGVEELSLAFGMINYPDLARTLLQDVYPEITEHQMKARLTSAGNSLLARNLCTLSEKATPQISEDLKMVIFPLVSFDFVLQLNLATITEKKKLLVHVQKGKDFCVHSTKQGIIHLLEHGNIKALLDRIMLYLPENRKSVVVQGSERVLQELTTQVGSDQNANVLVAALRQNGWNEKLAKEFSLDFTHPVLLASMVRIDANNRMTADETRQARIETLIYLMGRKHSWLMDSSIDDSQSDKVHQVTSKSLRNTLSAFLEN